MCIGLVVLAVSARMVPAALDPQRPVYSAEVRMVLLQATVRNQRGELITNLERNAFRVYEDGKAQALSQFLRDDVPVSLGIALDNSGSMRSKRESVEAAALALVRGLNPQDEVFVLNFGDKQSLDVPFTRDIGVLEAGIAHVDSIGGTALRDAIDAAMAYLTGHGARERKALLVVSDGLDNASDVSREHVRELARRSSVVIYAIGLLDDQDAGKAKRGREDLDDLAEETGGVAYYARSLKDVGGLALELARQIRSQYTLGYSPINQALDGSYRRIRVVAQGPGHLVVRTRSGYRATWELLAGHRPSADPGGVAP